MTAMFQMIDWKETQLNEGQRGQPGIFYPGA